MKVNLELLKVIIRLLILLILFVMLFIISAFLYSAKFWPDVYTYISANVTIKRIPTISELNFTILETSDFTTEGYFTSDVTGTDLEDFTGAFEDFFNDRNKRDTIIEDITEDAKDYIDMPKSVVVNYVFDLDDNTTKFMTALRDSIENNTIKVMTALWDNTTEVMTALRDNTTKFMTVLRDSVDETKLTKSDSKDVEMLDEDSGMAFQKLTNDTTHPASVFPWLAAIFIRNGTNNQFDYYCDGTLLSDKAILTAGRCLQRANETVNADDVIVFLGKRSLQSSADGESIQKVKQVILHPNFSLQKNTAQNDLAVLLLEDVAVFSDRIQPACLIEHGETGDAVATAWGESLSLIRFIEKNQTCTGESIENTFCATYGASVALCPSYGGVYASLQEGRWCAGGVRAGDVTRRGLCFDKTVAYTDLRQYSQWLKEIVQ